MKKKEVLEELLVQLKLVVQTLEKMCDGTNLHDALDDACSYILVAIDAIDSIAGDIDDEVWLK